MKTALVVTLLLVALSTSGSFVLSPNPWNPLSYKGVSLERHPLVSEAVLEINKLFNELFPEEKRGEPFINEEDINIIVDQNQFLGEVSGRLKPNTLQTIAFVTSCELPIWINWQNHEVQFMQRMYQRGQRQTVYLMAAVLGHEMGHVLKPESQYGAHEIAWALLDIFSKQGKLKGYEQIVEYQKIRASRPYEGKGGLSRLIFLVSFHD